MTGHCLVGRAGAGWLPVDVEAGLLAHVQPQDPLRPGVGGAAHSGQHLLTQGHHGHLHLSPAPGYLEAPERGLAAAVDLVAWYPTEVRTANHWVRQLLDLLEVVCHGRSLKS